MSLLDTRGLMRMKRTTPRIISRSYGDKLRRTEGSGAENLPSPSHVQPPAAPPMPNDVEAELQAEIFMKGGVAVSASAKFEAANSAVGEPMDMYAYAQKHRDELEGADLTQNKEVVELPGVANEVESYPCPVCGPDKVFLTVNGLERHAHEEHPHALDTINASIARIQKEWNRRRTQGFLPPLQTDIGEDASYVSEKGTVIIGRSAHHTHHEPCKICEAIVDTSQPTAMEYHMQAHKKNNELRQYLLDEYGQRFVDFVTCKECALVFVSGRALAEHVQSFHKRRRYVCRWCGKMFTGMSQLNMHKMQVHNIQTHNNASAANYVILESGDDSQPSTSNAPPTEAAENEENGERCQQPRVDDIHHTNARIVESLNGANVDDSAAPCKTKCQMCGLVIMKPSLLLRHMVRVHNKQSFAAEVTSRFSIPLKFTILGDGRVTWTCCDEDFCDRERVLQHRRLMHGVGANLQMPTTAEVLSADESDRTNLQQDGVPITCQEILLETEPILSTADSDEDSAEIAATAEHDRIDNREEVNSEAILHEKKFST